MAQKSYVPRAGDIIWLQFDPQAGHEQGGHRPAVVITGEKYNRLSGLMICCPMTSSVKGYPFEVLVNKNSAILADQIKSLDWKARKAVFKSKIAPSVFLELKSVLKLLVLSD